MEMEISNKKANNSGFFYIEKISQKDNAELYNCAEFLRNKFGVKGLNASIHAEIIKTAIAEGYEEN